MSHDPYVFAAMAVLIMFALFRRFWRLFGRQRLQPTRIRWRIGLFGLLAVLLVLRGMRSASLAEASVAGLAAGVALAWLGLKLTRFETVPEGVYFTPNGYIGAILAAMLLGRLAYRFGVLYPAMQAEVEQGNPLAAFQRSPLTLAAFGLLIGYYLAYFAGLLMRGAALGANAAADQDRDAASPPSGP
jgi:hypothetical protein